MMKNTYIAFLVSILFAANLHAQQNPSFQVYNTYNAATDLLDKGEYVAAAQQFKLVEESRVKAGTQTTFESELSLVKENAQYYEALCAMNLDNDDAQSMLLRFIKDHPENPLVKLAYYQIGRSYSRKEQFAEAIEWFNKITADDLNGEFGRHA